MEQTYKQQIELINKQIKELVGVYRDTVRDWDISESEFWVWYTLVTIEGEFSQQDICNMWSLPKQTVNTIVSQMKRKKFARLEATFRARNRKIIYLTEEGKRYGERIIAPITDAEERSFEQISCEELIPVTNTLGKYITILKKELQTTHGEA